MMAVWAVYLSLGLLVALNASVKSRPVGNERCSECKEGWTPYDCRCFKYFNNYLMWVNAEKTCLDYDANLASVHSQEEYMFVQNLIRYETQGTTSAWIGGFDAVAEGVWLWSDGSRMNYQIWSPGEPDNDGYEHCIQMNYGNGNWNDNKCHAEMPFVCAY